MGCGNRPPRISFLVLLYNSSRPRHGELTRGSARRARIIRPIPRRPFNVNFTSATPPDEDSAPATPHKFITANDLHFLDPRQQNQQGYDDSHSLSRAASLLNLTSSTLFGIYAPTVSPRDRFGDDRDDTPTPWGTGAMTPVKQPTLDEDTFELMRERSGRSRGGGPRSGRHTPGLSCQGTQKPRREHPWACAPRCCSPSAWATESL